MCCWVWTFSRPGLFSARDTVDLATRASAATSLIVTALPGGIPVGPGDPPGVDFLGASNATFFGLGPCSS